MTLLDDFDKLLAAHNFRPGHERETSQMCVILAGEVKLMSTGASPISTEVFEFLRVCFGATVSEGYGMTETACTIAMTRPDDATMGHVGAPLDCCEIKLEDIPDMNYKNTDQPYPRGEVRLHANTLTRTCTHSHIHKTYAYTHTYTPAHTLTQSDTHLCWIVVLTQSSRGRYTLSEMQYVDLNNLHLF